MNTYTMSIQFIFWSALALLSCPVALAQQAPRNVSLLPMTTALGDMLNNLTQTVSKVNISEVVDNVVSGVEPDDLDFVFVFCGLMVMCRIFIGASSRVLSK